MGTLNVALCEDTPRDALRIRTLLEQSPIPSNVTHFATADDFLESFTPGLYDLVLMDIYLTEGGQEHATGIAAVEALRQIDERVPVAFTTTSHDHALDGYRLFVHRYLIKPVQPAALEEVLELALSIKQSKPGITMRVDRKDITVAPDQIIMLEQQGHYCHVNLSDGSVLKVRQKLSELKDQLDPASFFHCHQSYLVNLAFVQGVDADSMAVLLYGGKRAMIRRNWAMRTRTAWEDWLFDTTRKKSEAFAQV